MGYSLLIVGIAEGALNMNIKLIGSALVVGFLLSIGSVGPAQAQAQRNYDCSKPGNANKTVCKAAAKPAPAARTYDCTKLGNANKAACKTAAATTPTPTPRSTATSTARNYDCTKPGNANKAACKAVVAPPATTRTTTHAPSAATSAGGSQGATAKCRDNTYSHSKTHSGACSHHGGVATWY